MEEDLLLFFGSHMDALPIYRRLEACILSQIPDVRLKIQKSQISFYNRHLFACVSFARVRPAASQPPVWLVVTFGLDHPVDSPRIDIVTEPYPNRWTHHLLLSSPDEVDEQLMNWLQEAACFSQNK